MPLNRRGRIVRESHKSGTTRLRSIRMRNLLRTTGAACALAIAALGESRPTNACADSAGHRPSGRRADLVSIPLEITVNRPAAEVWKRVGKFCDIGEWLQIPLHDHVRQGRRIRRRPLRRQRGPRRQDRAFVHLHPARAGTAGRTTCITARSRHARSPRPPRSSSTRCSSTTRCWPTMPRARRTRRANGDVSRQRWRT